MRVTLKDIAERSGFSVPTVSQILNNNAHLFKAGTRKRVLAAARELGYRPNSAARTMRSGRFGCVALLQSTDYVRSNLPRGLLDGIHDGLADQGLILMLAKLPDEKLTSEGYVPTILRQWTADALIIDYNINVPDRMSRLIREHGIPSVWINTKGNADCVRPDDFEAGQRATKALLKLGHERIAYADFHFDPPQKHYSRADRYEGYAKGMKEAGLKPILLAPKWPKRAQDAVDVARRHLAPAGRPTAVVAYSAQTGAAAFMLAARDMGLDVPADLSVVTFHDEPVDVFMRPVATMTVPVYEVGTSAVSVLLKKLASPERAVKPVVLRFGFSEGETLAKAPKG